MSKNVFLGIIGVCLVGGGIIYYLSGDDEDTIALKNDQQTAALYKQGEDGLKIGLDKKEKEEPLLKRLDSNASDVSFTSLTQGGSKRHKRKKGSKKSKRRSKRSRSKSKSK